MLISQKSKETIDACRFCWMCRHVCPIGNATGQERNTARARALTLSLVERGAVRLSDVVDNVWECALCGGCTNNCMTGWDPVKFTKEVRLEAVSNGEAPEYIMKLVDNIEATGNAYGLEKPDMETFFGLKLAYDAQRIGGSMPTVYNAANEKAVGLFLDRKIAYLQIPELIREAMEQHKVIENPNVEEILETEASVYDFIEKVYSERQ